MATNQVISIDPETGLKALDGLLGDPAKGVVGSEDLCPVEQVPFQSGPIDKTAHQFNPSAPVSVSIKP